MNTAHHFSHLSQDCL